MQGENDDYCDVCGGDGELICCDNCPKVYHKECHDPPLRNIPRYCLKEERNIFHISVKCVQTLKNILTFFSKEFCPVFPV